MVGAVSNSTVAQIAEHCPNFKAISVGARYLKELDLISAITQHLPNLEELTITEGQIYDDELQTLSKCKRLRKLQNREEPAEFYTYSYGNLLQDIGSTLVSLDIYLDDSIGGTPAEILDFMIENCPNLEYLSLETIFYLGGDGNGSDDDDDEDGMFFKGEEEGEEQEEDDEEEEEDEEFEGKSPRRLKPRSKKAKVKRSCKLIDFFNNLKNLQTVGIMHSAADFANDFEAACKDASVEIALRKKAALNVAIEGGLYDDPAGLEITPLDDNCISIRIRSSESMTSPFLVKVKENTMDELLLEVTMCNRVKA